MSDSFFGDEPGIRLARALLSKTRRGAAAWEPLSRDSFTHSAVHGGFIIRSADGDGQPPYVFEVLNDQGVVIESLSSHLADQERRTLFGDLYRFASRKAHRADETLNSLLAEFADDEPPF